MDKKVIIFLGIILLITSLSFGSSLKIGDKINDVLFTDIITEINDEMVESFNINGSTAIYVNDLKKIPGVTVLWDNDNRKVIVKSGGIDNDTSMNNTENNKKIEEPKTEANNFNYVKINNKVTITDYLGTEEYVVIPNVIENLPVTSIASKAFYDKSIIGVMIPNSIKSIGQRAFSFNNLTTITIPDSVTNMGDSAFSYNDLTTITVPNSVTNIGENVFSDNKLNTITIPNSVVNIGSFAFSSNDFNIITIPNSVVNIGSGAFGWNNLVKISIGNSVTNIGYGAFMNNSLTYVVIPESVTKIEDSAFENNLLESIVIPNTVTFIGDDAFKNNPDLVIKGYLKSRAESYAKENGITFEVLE